MSHDSGSTPVFSMSTDLPDVSFISSRATGRWALAESLSPELSSYLSQPYQPVDAGRLPMIALNMGRPCNLDCTYCLTGSLREQRSLLNEEIGMTVVERVMELEVKDRHIVFHGSEPMLNFPMIKRLVQHAESLNSDISFSIQTNGTLLNQRHLRFLKKHAVGIGISLDGLKVHQDATRRYKDGSSTYATVRNAVGDVRERQGSVSVITVVTSSNVLELQEIVADYESIGVRAVFFHPVCCSANSSLLPNEHDLISQMLRVCDYQLDRRFAGESTIRIQNFSKVLRTFFDPRTSGNCLPCGGGSHQPLLAIDIDGSIYPCDFFWENHAYRIGNISDTSLSGAD